MDPVWSDAELRNHLEFLNGDDLMGRATGTPGYARAAAYVAARMREFRLQPAVEGEYRFVYGASVNSPISSLLQSVGRQDSTTYLPGIDYLPDARSDSGRARVERMVVAAGPPAPGSVPARPFGVIVSEGTGTDLRAWRDAGARVAVVVGALRPRFEPAPIANLLVAQMTSRTAARLLGESEPGLSEYLAAAEGETITLPRVFFAHIVTDFHPQGGAINMLGYYAGKHPVHRGDVVILCADLDAVGRFAGVRAVDFANFGISTAAVLEVARNLGFVSRRWSIPERSVMVAVWSGSQTGHAGLRYFLENPTWPLDKIHSVVYVGLSAREDVEVRDILDAHGIPLKVIPAPREPLFEPDVVLRPDPAVLRLARSRDGEVPIVELPDESVIVDSAVARARGFADAAYQQILLRSTDPATFFPAPQDTLAPPQAAGSQ